MKRIATSEVLIKRNLEKSAVKSDSRAELLKRIGSAILNKSSNPSIFFNINNKEGVQQFFDENKKNLAKYGVDPLN